MCLSANKGQEGPLAAEQVLNKYFLVTLVLPRAIYLLRVADIVRVT